MHSLPLDPGRLLRYRDSIYASDLLVCAISEFNFFTVLKGGERTFQEICGELKIKSRPADVLLSLLLSMELIERSDDKYRLNGLSERYLVSDSPDSPVPYYRSLANPPPVRRIRRGAQNGQARGVVRQKGRQGLDGKHERPGICRFLYRGHGQSRRLLRDRSDPRGGGSDLDSGGEEFRLKKGALRRGWWGGRRKRWSPCPPRFRSGSSRCGPSGCFSRSPVPAPSR